MKFRSHNLNILATLISDVIINRSHYNVFMISHLWTLNRFVNFSGEIGTLIPVLNKFIALIYQKETIDSVMEMNKSLNPTIVALNNTCFDTLNGHFNVTIILQCLIGILLAFVAKLTRRNSQCCKSCYGFPLDCSISNIKKQFVNCLVNEGYIN